MYSIYCFLFWLWEFDLLFLSFSLLHEYDKKHWKEGFLIDVNHSGSERFNCRSPARVIYFLVFLILGVIILSAVPGHNWSHFWKSCGWMGNWQVWSQEYDNVVRCTICSRMAAYQLCSECPHALLWSDHHRNGLWCNLTCCSSKFIRFFLCAISTS